MNVNLNEIKIGDVFGEESHYVLTGIDTKNNKYSFNRIETGTPVTLSGNYVQDLLSTSDQYNKEVKVGKEDKKDGTLGIRSIFEGIGSSSVFTVVFKKQDSKKSNKAYEAEIDAKATELIEKIEKARTSKKGVANTAKIAISEVLRNPITQIIEGEERILRGYKIQFSSRDGRYNCIDVDIAQKEGIEKSIRPVNINTISQLIIDGTKYIVG